MNILVTGGAGFIGSNFVNYMAKKYSKHTIYNLDSLTYAGNINNIEVLDYSNHKFLYADITDYEEIQTLFENNQFDLVVHFAAESHVDNSIKDPKLFVNVNVMGTQVLLDCARKFGNIRFHHVSTDEVYGDLPLGRKDLLFTESTPVNPSSPYSASKAGSDLLAMAYQRTYKLPVTMSRCSNNYGKYQFPEKLIPLMISKALKEEKLPIYGAGVNVRDWLHVYDHCTAVDAIVFNGKIGEIYNIGGNNEMQNIEIVKIILKRLGKAEDLITFVEDRKGHDLRYAIDNSKITSELGWKPSYTFEQGIEETVDWYLSNTEWIENVLSKEYEINNKELVGSINE
ncbi:MAG: dTDP-glucose 4,6-dehydratase [Oscillospiraceae bacterium]|nr:dTDP-glucose 4,6-dehydratase [Oscillospiraceae bacterium]